MRFVVRSFVFAVVIIVMMGSSSGRAQDATPVTATPVASSGCADAASLDLPAVTLTTADLIAAGLEGFGISSAGPYLVEDDIAYLAESLHREAGEVRSILTGAGYEGSYFSTQSLPSDTTNRASLPIREVQIGVYPFADVQGAAAGYELLTDESGVPEAEDVEGTVTFGDESELTRNRGDNDPDIGQPFRELELEFRRGCLVVSLALFNYGDAAAEPEVDAIEQLGERLVARVDDVVAGRTPGLDALALNLQPNGDLLSRSLVFYAMLDGEAVREWDETDEDFAGREKTWGEIGFASALRSDTPIPSGEDIPDDDLRRFNTLLQFPDEEIASAYLQGAAGRFAGSPLYLEVTEIAAAPALGDESVALAVTRETDGVRWDLNELFVRVGDIVTVTWIERPDESLAEPEVGIEPLAELAETQVACLVAGGVCPPVPISEGLPGLAASPAPTPMS